MFPQTDQKLFTPFGHQGEEGMSGELFATPSMCYHCFDVLIDTLTNNNKSNNTHNNNTTSSRRRSNDPPEFSKHLVDKSVECPLFVTWEKKRGRNNDSNASWQLRGCIGTLSPRQLIPGIGEYALTAALRDRRFHPIALSELPSLRVAVSLLVKYEVCRNVYDWTVGVHGILIKFTISHQHYNATYLPEVAKEQGWDHQTTVASLIQKAGYHGPVVPELLSTIHCTRYQSSKHKVTFGEYVMENCDGESPIPQTSKQGSRQWAPCNIH